MLSDEEKFRFDLEGYLVIPGVLSSATMEQLFAAITSRPLEPILAVLVVRFF